ncbi:rCG54605 [Rattus norvegicus]|uniref:RCG54605 n=1 Tax=Rattus norvegicus TaxID=10116 RepID=A6JAE0_RAT|nr:rCG54605 [Rattus norvegicus]
MDQKSSGQGSPAPPVGVAALVTSFLTRNQVCRAPPQHHPGTHPQGPNPTMVEMGNQLAGPVMSPK